jgi:lipid A 3-O-deacylase
MKTCAMWSVLLVALACGNATAQESPDYSQSSTWRFEFANDVIFDSDNQFTNGFALQKHGPVASSLDATDGTVAFGKGLARFFLPSGEGLNYREAWSFGQNMQTPEEIENPDIILDDLPYMGMLGWSNSFVAFDDQRMSAFGWMLGVVGEKSFGDDVQETIHEWIDAEEPMGWEHQLDDEPIFSLFYTKKKKLWRKPSFDGAVAFNAAASNFMSFGELSLEMRFGRMPQGFAYIPDPIGRGLHYNATIPADDGTAIYGTVVVRATSFLVDMLREGNTFVDDNEWTDNNTVEPEDVIGQVIVGFHYERPKWALRFTFWASTDTVDPDTLVGDEDPENKGGTITYEWRFD